MTLEKTPGMTRKRKDGRNKKVFGITIKKHGPGMTGVRQVDNIVSKRSVALLFFMNHFVFFKRRFGLIMLESCG